MDNIEEVTKSVLDETRSQYNLKGVNASELFAESKKVIQQNNQSCSVCNEHVNNSQKDFVITFTDDTETIDASNLDFVCEDHYGLSDNGVSRVSNQSVSGKSHLLETINKWDAFFQQNTPKNILPTTVFTLLKYAYIFIASLFVVSITNLFVDLPVNASLIFDYLSVATDFIFSIVVSNSTVLLLTVIPLCVVVYTILKIYEPVEYIPPTYSLNTRYKLVPVIYSISVVLWVGSTYIIQNDIAVLSRPIIDGILLVTGLLSLALLGLLPYSFREYLRVDRDTNYALSVSARSAKLAAEDGRTVLTGNSSEIGSVEKRDIQEVVRENYDLVAEEYNGVVWMTLLNLAVAYAFIAILSTASSIPISLSTAMSMGIFLSPILIFSIFVVWRMRVKKNLDAQLVEAKQTAEQQFER